MKDRDKTKEQLLRAFSKLRRRLIELEPAKAENASRESGTELYSVFDNAPIAMVLVDGDRRVRRANRAALEFTGRRSETVKGLRAGEALRCIHAADDERGCGFGPSCEKCEIRRMLLETLETDKIHRRVEAELRTSMEGSEDVLSLLVSTIPLVISGSRRVLVCLDDVTWLKRAEEALKRSEERYALAQRAAGIGSWDWDIAKGTLYWSERIEPLFGFARGEFGATYEAFLECVHPDDRQLVVDSVNACLQEGAEYAIEHRIVRPDGTARWVSEKGDVIRDATGKAIRMLGIVQDITERRKAREEARDLSKFPSENPNPVLRISRNGTVMYANKASEALLRAWKCETGGALPEEWRQRAADVLDSGSRRDFECAGCDRTLLLSFAPVTDADYVNIYGLDITDRKDAEEKALAQSEFVRRVIESLPHPFYVIDVSDYTVKMANSAAVQGTLPSRSTCHSLTHDSPTPCNTADHPCPLEEIKRTKKPQVVEHIHRDRSGAKRTVEVHCYPIFDSEENVAHMIEYAMDITEKKRAEEADRLKRLSEMLINFQEDERRRVARDLHDEIGQVLTAIKITLGMILKDHPGINAAVKQELEEAVKLMDSAMRFTRNISARLRPEMLDSLGLLPCLEHEVAFAAKKSGINISLTDKGLRARLDPRKEITLYRVVQEALNNIIKHAGATEAEVSILGEGDAVILSVRDNGRGVQTSDLQTSRGLGILGMRERIASVGGTFALRVQPGGGTLLEVRVPLEPVKNEAGTGDTQ